MPYRRKDSPIYWVSYTDQNGERVRRSTETTEKKEAEALEAKWKLEAYRSKHWGEKPPITFEQLMVAYLNAHLDKRSANADRYRTANLRQWLSGQVINTMTSANIRNYVAMRTGEGVGHATINREISLLSAAINWANREWDYNLPNPVRGNKLKEPESRVRWIKQDEAKRLLDAAASSVRARHLESLVRLALHTGMRRGEMLGLEWNRVDLHVNLVYLDGVHTKTGKRRTIPLNSEARSALVKQARYRAKHCPASPWVFCHKDGERIKDVKHSFTRACEIAGIEDFRFHDMRHTCAAWLVTAGVPLSEVRDLLGHASVTMTEKYAHLAPENVKAAVAMLEDGWSRSGHDEKKELPRDKFGT